MSDDKLLQVVMFELRYAAFNARRSLGTVEEQHAEVVRVPDGAFIQCSSAPKSGYFNRLVTTTTGAQVPSGVVQVERVGQRTGEASLRILAAQPRPGQTRSATPVVRYREEQDLECLRAIEATNGKPIPADVVQSKRHFYATEQFRNFAVVERGVLKGIATSFVDGNVAWLANAYTFPEFRRTGVHSALLEERLQDACRLGLESVYCDVEPDSDSERNLLRAGFRHVMDYIPVK